MVSESTRNRRGGYYRHDDTWFLLREGAPDVGEQQSHPVHRAERRQGDRVIRHRFERMEQVLCENRDRLNFLERKIAHLEFALKGLKEDQHKP